ncbi:MAG TPA: MBL fold metallo-hydrolase [Actinomycetaceae bacterium]|nr:MBL fold metallo-hydrolase [Actinomycetaceae bacterium]
MTTAWAGGVVGDLARAVLAPNPGPMTLEGTNTWVLRAPGAAEAVVVDPGPVDVEEHLAAVFAASGQVALTLLTHHHGDHTGAVPRWQELTGSPVRGAGRGTPLADGEVLTAGGVTVEVLNTPGHTPDSVCLLLPDGLLLTGDTVLGRGSTVVPWPEGDLADYLASLDRLVDLVRAGRVRRLAPGHGPVVEEPLALLEQLRRHRHERLDQVRGAVAGGARTAEEVVRAVYGELDGTLARAARSTVQAALVYLGHTPDRARPGISDGA